MTTNPIYPPESLGPYLGHPNDPRSEPDDRDWATLTTAERRARLDTLTRKELIELLLEQRA